MELDLINIIFHQMKLSLSRSSKMFSRKEPISAFIFVMAMTDIVLGGVNEQWTLLSWGVLMAMMAGLIRWLQIQKARKPVFYSPPRRYLQPSSSSNLTPLPPLKRKRDYRQS